MRLVFNLIIVAIRNRLEVKDSNIIYCFLSYYLKYSKITTPYITGMVIVKWPTL